MSFLTLTGVQKTFPGGTVAVEDFNLDAVRGEFVSVLGPSGCGKTTTLRMVAGFERPTAGTIMLGGSEITHQAPAKRPLNMVFQDYALFPHLTVGENVAFGLKVKRMGKDERTERIAGALTTMQLSGLSERRPSQLSGGQRQRVALARALVNRPQALLLDEPLGALDLKLRKEMQAELKEVHRATGTTFLYVTHDQEEALTMSDRIAVINQGKCIQCDAPELLYKRPRTRFVASFFRGCNVLKAECVEQVNGRVSFRIAGTVIENVPALAPAAADGHIALRAENV